MPTVDNVSSAQRSARTHLMAKALGAVLVAAALLFHAGSASAWNKHDRDNLWNPPDNGPSLKLFTFWGPGIRLIADDRIPIEKDMSDLHLQGMADANFGYTEVSAHADVRVFLFTLGFSGGYRNDWHLLEFKPDATGHNHGESHLNLKARAYKDDAGDWRSTSWGWGEGRLGMLLPMPPAFFAVSTIAARYEARPDNSFDYEYGTVHDRGVNLNWETYVVYRNRDVGFIGPALRVLDVPRTLPGYKTRQTEWQYGLFAGTQPRWSSGNQDLLMLRVFTTAGLNNDFFGTEGNFFGGRFRFPLTFIFGYQTDLTF